MLSGDYVTDFDAALNIDEFAFEHPKNRPTSKRNRLQRLGRSDKIFRKIEKQFLRGWKHPGKQRPFVYTVFKILFPEDALKPYLDYRDKVDESTALSRSQSSRSPGNERLLFHGTTRRCLLAEQEDSVRLCDLPDCSLCCIIRKSFDVKKCGTKHKFRRFGTGIYTTGCSSKADDYSCNGSNEKAKFRTLLVTRVIVGKTYRRKHNAVNLTAPPAGHHSVFGEPGADLNYEETVVYSNDAVRPAYLIVYADSPPPVSRPSSPTAMSKLVPHIDKAKLKNLLSVFKTPLAT